MKTPEEAVRRRLAARREFLAEAAETRQQEALVELLRRVDEALARVEVGDWGRCTVCRESMSTDRLLDDPLVAVCLECLSEDDRRSLERDLESAARVQRALLPARALTQGCWEVAWLWEPKGVVSGDHVDLLVPAAAGEPLHLLLGDVVGKGVAASLLQSNLHALFRALVTPATALADLLLEANRLFAAATAGASYASLVVARLAAEGMEGMVELVNAGHPRPLLADRRGVRPVEGAGLPLGLFAGSEYRSRRLTLAPGDVLLLYTDGWTEAERDGEELGVGRAAAALRQAAGLPLDELLTACRETVDRFLDGRSRADDLTLVAVRRRE